KHVRLAVGGDLRGVGESNLKSRPPLVGEWDGLVAVESGGRALPTLTPGEPLQESEDGRQSLLRDLSMFSVDSILGQPWYIGDELNQGVVRLLVAIGVEVIDVPSLGEVLPH